MATPPLLARYRLLRVLPHLLADLSEWTWQLLRDAPFRPREETVTEVLLTELHRRGAGRVWVHKSTVHEERDLGLDWASAFRTSAGWIRAAVQAKNVGGHRFGTYPELRKPSAIEQADFLMHTAAMMQAVPLYAFFNSEVSPFGPAGTRVSIAGCGRQILIRGDASSGPPWATGVAPLGVLIAHASDVIARVIPPPATNQRAVVVNEIAMPWECLFCPSWNGVATGSGGATSPRNPSLPLISEVALRLAAAIQAALPDNQSDMIVAPPEWLTSEPPRWVDVVREGGAPELEDDAPPARFFLVIDPVDDSLPS